MIDPVDDALGLLLNAAVLWTTPYLDAVVEQLRALPAEQREYGVLDEDVARLSPLKHANLNVLGRYTYSPRTLSRATLAAAGLNAKDFIDRRVVLEAKRLLAHTDQSAAQIADRLGFSSALHQTLGELVSRSRSRGAGVRQPCSPGP